MIQRWKNSFHLITKKHKKRNVRYSHIIILQVHISFSVHVVDNDIDTVTNNDNISTEDIINAPDIHDNETLLEKFKALIYIHMIHFYNRFWYWTEYITG